MQKKYAKGCIVEGTVTGIADYGIFVSFTNGYSGLIHISEISNKFVKDIGEYAKVKDKIKVKILAVDDDTRHLKLSIKNINKNIDNLPNNQNDNKIQETSLGYKTLGRNLDKWIQKKKKELLTNANQNN